MFSLVNKLDWRTRNSDLVGYFGVINLQAVAVSMNRKKLGLAWDKLYPELFAVVFGECSKKAKAVDVITGQDDVVSTSNRRHNRASDVDSKQGRLCGLKLLVIVKFVVVARVNAALFKAGVVCSRPQELTIPVVHGGPVRESVVDEKEGVACNTSSIQFTAEYLLETSVES